MNTNSLHYHHVFKQWLDEVLNHQGSLKEPPEDLEVPKIPEKPEYWYPDLHYDFKSQDLDLEHGFRRFVLTQAERRFFISPLNSTRFIHYVIPLFDNLEECETWVNDPLDNDDFLRLFNLVNDYSIELFLLNDKETDIDCWTSETQSLFRRLGMACICILAWQHYSPCVQFVYKLNPSLKTHLEELLILLQDDITTEEYPVLFDAAQCVSARLSHFDNIMQSAQQGFGQSFHRSQLKADKTPNVEASPEEIEALKKMLKRATGHHEEDDGDEEDEDDE